MNIKKIVIGGLFTVLLAVFAVLPVRAETLTLVDELLPNWDEGVFSAYVGPPAYGYVSPGATALYDGREAGIIKAGFNTAPADDEGLFAFKPTVTIDDFAAGTLTYDVETQAGVNPVWMTIEIDTGDVDNRDDNTSYQFVPTSNPAGWNTFDAGAGLWQKWNNNEGDTTGNPLIPLSDVVSAHTGLNVVRTYLRLGMGESYYNGGTGTTAWVDKATLGGVTYDFVVNPFLIPSECSEITGLGVPIVGTAGSDNINGTSGNDLIFALGGSDRVDGKGGADCIVGGDGSDKLIGGNGNDVILGGAGSDSIEGNNQADKLYGDEGADSIKGGNQDDELFGGADSDSLQGENGADILNGDSGSDSLKGGSGNDTLTGGDGVDSAKGEAGNNDVCDAESENTCEA